MGRNISENEAVVDISINPNHFRQSDAHSTAQRGVGQPQQTAEARSSSSSHPTPAAVPPAENLVLMVLIVVIKQQKNHDPPRV